ncbi:asparagine synthase [Rasiella rasia]|uniref:asparagine synthase (glutamine-hydrolyzing) n=1 Tax=Rasiella rasia TaxID=2744027 RepID=A0A6G6GQ75_9FLAO|nr:asparagine synthase C-terminal domain-containing protein [Rasiella rasia]QIE60624.1 asparagine synthase [Rasiella rasia]
MKKIKTAIIPTRATFAKVRAPHELHKEAICVFAATGFFLNTDTYFKDQMVLPPGSLCSIDEDGFFLESTPWFQWHNSPRAISFEAAVEEFSQLFETIVAEQIGEQKVILPLSGGLDSRTQAVAMHHLQREVQSYSYDFKGGYAETSIGKKIAKACDFNFNEYHVGAGYLWEVIEELAEINQCYSEFTHPRQMAIFNEYAGMGDVFSLGHWGDVLFDGSGNTKISEEEQLQYLLKKIIKKGGMELANTLWLAWELPGSFSHYLSDRVQRLLAAIPIKHTGAKIRAFKSLYWAPRWTATNLAVFEEKKPITLPYFDNRMCEFICTIPEEYLADRKLQIAYIKQRNAQLAKITWEENKPFNLYTFPKNRSPYNIPYRILNKVKRETRALFGNPYIQRNWELQFLGASNDEKLKEYLFNEHLESLVSQETIRSFYKKFTTQDAVYYSHPVSMLLTLSLKMKQLARES